MVEALKKHSNTSDSDSDKNQTSLDERASDFRAIRVNVEKMVSEWESGIDSIVTYIQQMEQIVSVCSSIENSSGK